MFLTVFNFKKNEYMKAFCLLFCQTASLLCIIWSCLVPAAAQTGLWGLTSSGGQGAGTIVRMDDNGSNFTSVIFPVLSGKTPSGDLLKATNGKFYGMTSEGGDNGGGVIFEYDLATNGYQVLHHFAAGSIPKGSLMESGGKLYGLTSEGGDFGNGVIFEYNLATSIYTVLYNFGNSVNDGKFPEGSLVISGDNFYGITSSGGNMDFGTIFQFDPSSEVYTVLHSFDEAEGSFPSGNLVVSGQTLYGMTSSGGTLFAGVIFEYNLLAGSINILHNFDDDVPFGSLIHYNGIFYGMTSGGGDNFEGSIFGYDPVMNIYTELFSFDSNAFGSYPFGSMVESGGKLYGMTNGGGNNFSGVLFEYALLTNTYNIQHHFDPDITGGGASPLGCPIVSDGKLYGMTSSGGTAGFGTLYEYTIIGGPYIVKVNFDSAPLGSSPEGSLIKSESNWYGMTRSGGNSNEGSIFKYDPSGPGTLSALHHFSGSDGGSPSNSMVLYNGYLYGMTSQGGTNNGGVLFQYNLTTATYTVKYNFATGSTPKGSLLEWNGVFYGLSSNGGSGNGEIFKYDPMNNIYTTLHAFDGAEGAFPNGDLVQLNGILYGMATTTNTDPGVLFQYDPVALEYDVVHFFAGGINDGASPYGSLVSLKGRLYGMTRDGGDSDKGVIFKYNPTGIGTYTVLRELDNTNGGNPEGSLIILKDSIYGMTKQGGSFGGGVVFKCDTTGASYIVLKHLAKNSGQTPFGSLSPSGCINPVITAVNADVNPISCVGNSSNLSVSGDLHGANDWKWYTSSCGGTLVGTGATISVMPETSTAYFVRGDGGCATEAVCSSITLNIAVPVVTNKNDAGAGSLRAAITCASEGSTITFDPLVLGANDTIHISSASLVINKNILINQTPSTIVKIKTTGPHPIFNVSTGKSLTLNYTNLFMNPNSPSVPGRAILNSGNILMSNINIWERSQNLSGNGSTIQNVAGSSVNFSSSNQIIIQN